MTSRAQKLTPNTALKLAIVASEQSQRLVARKARIDEVRMSKIVTGREEATEKERDRLAHILHRTAAELFPAAQAAVAS